MIKNTHFSYGYLTKIFHWGMFLVFLAMFMIAYVMINIPRSDFMFSLYDLHKATGILLFCLAIFRLTWRAINPQPVLAHPLPTWQIVLVKGNIISLYIVMFLMPVTGFLTSTMGGHPISIYHLYVIAPLADDKATSLFFSEAHEYLSYFFIFIFSLHVLGSLYHHYFIKDDTLKRMWVRSK